MHQTPAGRGWLVLFLLPLVAWIAPVCSAEPYQDGPWRYTLRRPAEGWQGADFDDAGWQEGAGGFGAPGTPGARIGTVWTGNNIWLRRQVVLPENAARPALYIHHDEDAEIYLNGRRVAEVRGYVTEYQVMPLDEKAKAALQPGRNLLAVHCRQTGGGQFIDVHLIDAERVPQLPLPPRATRPFASDLMTAWGAKVTPENAWREYPRPQLVRPQWQNLNGMWDYAIAAREAPRPDSWDGQILVPFALESKLSGVGRLLDPSESLWYHRTLPLDPQPGRRLLLNFEAVDYHCRVWLNDREVGEHTGGNTPFSFDITDAARRGDNVLVLRVDDATGGAQLRGKQRLDPHGIWYTRVSGIWQTVWLEEVPERYIEQLKLSTDIDKGTIQITPVLRGTPLAGEQLQVVARDSREKAKDAAGQGRKGSHKDGKLTVTIEQPRLWSPADPQLYDLTVTLRDGDGRLVDEVASYAGLRKVGLTRDEAGHWRFTLNHEPIFHWGTLDQGWWPDGLLTPPSDSALAFDVEFLKSAGFNMIRKHIKVEPRRFYYHCDRSGMMLWQDQVSGGANPEWTRLKPDPRDASWSDADHAQFLREFEAMVDTLENHPSIVVWVPFNEAWGQHRTVETGKWILARDPSRLVNIASGGNFWPVGHVVDEHRYPHPGFPFDPERYEDFVKVVGEFGGHGWPVQGHLWDNSPRNWGYGGLPQSLDEYKARYRESIRLLDELQNQGIAAGVYTQTTDVEGEINGLITYDRKVIKIPAEELYEIHAPLREP